MEGTKTDQWRERRQTMAPASSADSQLSLVCALKCDFIRNWGKAILCSVAVGPRHRVYRSLGVCVSKNSRNLWLMVGV